TFLAHVALLRLQLLAAHFCNLLEFHIRHATATWCRVKNFVRTGSLSAAKRSDSRATDSGTPSNSNKMFPGFTVATQYSGCPFPLPIRVSGGRAVTDLSGKIRIHSLPLRFMLRVNATRAASICVFVIQARSSVCRPNSPKLILRLREAVPLRLPRWDFRYFTRLGINGIKIRLRLVQLAAMAGAEEPLQSELHSALLPSYTSSISRRSFRKRCLLRRNRSRSECAKCAMELSLRGTIPSARFPRRSAGPSSASEFLPRRNPLQPAPLVSSPGGRRFGARSATKHSPRPIARPTRAS